MKLKKIIAFALAAVMTGTMIPGEQPEKTMAATVIEISPYSYPPINDGIFEGWGTSLCWWANRVGYSDSLSEQAAELFFGDTGLRMNIARFNIGGGDDPTHNHITRTDSAMPGYTVYKNGSVTYDWNADARQRNVLMKSIAACKTGLIVEMFSNSPPYYMTQSGCTSGGRDPGKNNLKDDCYDDFAEYFAEVCKHYTNEWGVKIQSVSPMNEPYTNFWPAFGPKQEGCHFDIGNSESKVITELQKSMQKRGLSDIIISASDETAIDTQIDAYKALSSDAKKAVSRIDTHTYGGSKRAELQQLALSESKNLWMSEVDGNGVSGQNSGDMCGGLWLSQRIAGDCDGLGCSAWILWQAIDKHICAAGFNGKKDSGMPDITKGFWGLAVADHDNNKIILSKKYYSMGQFTRYIRPGSRVLSTPNDMMASYDEKTKQLAIVAINASGSNKDIKVDLSQFTDIGKSVKVIRTSGSISSGENWKELTPITTEGSGFSASLLANSVTTYVIDDVESVTFDKGEIKLSSDMVTGSAAWKDSENDCKKVVDGNTSSYFDGVGGGWVQIDMKKEYQLDALAYAPRPGFEYRCTGGEFFASTDGEKWDKIYTISGVPSSGMHFITKLEDKKARYIKYAVPSGAPTDPSNKDSTYCCNIAEIKVYGHEGEKEPEEVVGDINKDGSITMADLIALKFFFQGELVLNEMYEKISDVNKDGTINVVDYCILKSLILDKQNS